MMSHLGTGAGTSRHWFTRTVSAGRNRAHRPPQDYPPHMWILCLIGLHSRRYHDDGTWDCGRCPTVGALL